MPGRVAAYIGSSAFVFFGLLIRFKALRNFWMWVLPDAGVMPKREQMAGASWHGIAVAESDERSGGKPVTVRAECTVSFLTFRYNEAEQVLSCAVAPRSKLRDYLEKFLSM